ncbi:hypothetical protein HMPREF0373_00496 [Eubacterium ramulus ATCC 29099]|uniref:Uncharacterized protein n=1 Tax=Eubacterium ramulus ATCC 29099 TaxID=1256908 RepID=U2PK08_EUBRA|nr:hypothetical protein HMPREF0373_00496 [Eubacterium ramulus ATCC 29099]
MRIVAFNGLRNYKYSISARQKQNESQEMSLETERKLSLTNH